MNLSLAISRDTEPHCSVNTEVDREAQLNAEQIPLEAVALAQKGMFINSAKMLIKLFDTNINTLNDSLMLNNVICYQLQRNEACADFNPCELNTIKSSCQKILSFK